MISPSKSLQRFQRQVCPDISIDSPFIIYRLLEELNKKEKGSKDNEKQN